MDVIPLLVFLSLVLVGMALAFFLYTVKQGDHEHADRLSLLPLEEDEMPQETKADKEEPIRQDLSPLSSPSPSPDADHPPEDEHEHDRSPHDQPDHL